MRVRRLRKRSIVAAVVLLFVSPLASAPGAAGEQATSFQTRTADVRTSDGVTLKAMVMQPDTPGPRPVVVLISAWGGGMTQNIMPAKELAERGYVVVAYGARGFGESGGQVQVASRRDLADVSTVIDWAIAHADADPTRVGVAGVSYGAGIGLLASAHDARIDAVASLSGWSDLVGSLQQNNTRHGLTAQILYYSGKFNGRLSAESDTMLRGIFDPELSEDKARAIRRWAAPRSPRNHLDALNRNAPATLLVQTWSETVFHPGQMVELYNGLTGPKRAEFHPGDHAATESGGLLGLPSDVWNSVYRWFDAYVAETDGSITGEPPVISIPRPGVQEPEGAPDWESAVGTPLRFFLGRNSGADGTLDTAGPTHWNTTVTANQDSLANGGVPLVTYSLEALTKNPPTVPMGLIDRNVAAVWQGAATESPMEIRGEISGRLNVIPQSREGTLVGYVYDVDEFGIGRLINYLPYSWTSANPGVPFAAELRFSPTAYTLRPGHHLALVVDTKDPLFIDENSGEGKLGFGSSVSRPSWLDVPIVK